MVSMAMLNNQMVVIENYIWLDISLLVTKHY